MITIAKTDECTAILNAGENDAIKNIFQQMAQIKDYGTRLCDLMENGLCPAGVWRPWCNANLSAAEKTWFIARYNELKTLLNGIA